MRAIDSLKTLNHTSSMGNNQVSTKSGLSEDRDDPTVPLLATDTIACTLPLTVGPVGPQPQKPAAPFRRTRTTSSAAVQSLRRIVSEGDCNTSIRQRGIRSESGIMSLGRKTGAALAKAFERKPAAAGGEDGHPTSPPIFIIPTFGVRDGDNAADSSPQSLAPSTNSLGSTVVTGDDGGRDGARAGASSAEMWKQRVAPYIQAKMISPPAVCPTVMTETHITTEDHSRVRRPGLGHRRLTSLSTLESIHSKASRGSTPGPTMDDFNVLPRDTAALTRFPTFKTNAQMRRVRLRRLRSWTRVASNEGEAAEPVLGVTNPQMRRVDTKPPRSRTRLADGEGEVAEPVLGVGNRKNTTIRRWWGRGLVVKAGAQTQGGQIASVLA